MLTSSAACSQPLKCLTPSAAYTSINVHGQGAEGCYLPFCMTLFTQTCKKLPHHPGTWKGSSNGQPTRESHWGVQGHLGCRERGSSIPYLPGAASLTSSELSLSAGALKTKAWPGLRRAPPRRGSTTGEESVPRKGLQSAQRTACMSAAGPRALPASACRTHGDTVRNRQERDLSKQLHPFKVKQNVGQSCTQV